MKTIIGVVGPVASGKDRLIDTLLKKGFIKFSLSDEIREELENLKPGFEFTRKDYQDLGDKKRKKFGNVYWAKKIAEKIKSSGSKKIVIDSIRNPSEVRYLKSNFDAFIIAIVAPFEQRINWAKNRKRNIDQVGKEKLIELLKRDIGLHQPEFGQQVQESMKLADIKIENNGTLSELDKKIKDVLKAQKML